MTQRPKNPLRDWTIEVTSRYGYMNAYDLARAAVEKGLEDRHPRNIGSHYSQIMTGKRPITGRMAKIFLELCENDSEMWEIIENMKRGGIQPKINGLLDDAYQDFRTDFLRYGMKEKMEAISSFMGFVEDQRKSKTIEDKLDES